MKHAATKTTNAISAKPKVNSGAKHAEPPSRALEAAAPSRPTLVTEEALAVRTAAPVKALVSKAEAAQIEPEAARPPAQMSREALIRHGAYLRYLRRRPGEGSEVDDWLGAEADLADTGAAT